MDLPEGIYDPCVCGWTIFDLVLRCIIGVPHQLHSAPPLQFKNAYLVHLKCTKTQIWYTPHRFISVWPFILGVASGRTFLNEFIFVVATKFV